MNDAGVTSDALYTNCTIALNPDTGKLVWHYQHVPNDQWDLDWVFERQIVEMTIDGTPAQGGDERRQDGDSRRARRRHRRVPVLGRLRDRRTSSRSIDPKTGAKTIDPEKWPDPKRPAIICPGRVRGAELAADLLQPADARCSICR